MNSFSAPALRVLFEHFYIGGVEQHREEWEAHRAPRGMIREDIGRFAKRPLFYDQNQEFLNIRSVPGHAAAGHTVFFETGPMPNTTIDDVARETEYGVQGFRHLSREICDRALHPVRRFLADPYQPTIKTTDRRGDPLAGVEFFGDVSTIDFLRGLYAAANMDNFADFRADVARKYNFNLGGGECYAVDIERLKDWGIHINHLSEGHFPRHPLLNKLAPERRIDLLQELGVVQRLDEPTEATTIDEIYKAGMPVGEQKGKNVQNLYIRWASGLGVADDIALVNATFLTSEPGVARRNPRAWASKFIGAFLGDFLDTVEKSNDVVVQGGFDQAVGHVVRNAYRELCRDTKFRKIHQIAYRPDNSYELVDRREMLDFIMASANLPIQLPIRSAGKKLRRPIHSSQNYFLRLHEEGALQTCTLAELAIYAQRAHAVDSDYALIQARRRPEATQLSVGFHRVPWTDVQKVLDDRQYRFREHHQRQDRLQEMVNFHQPRRRIAAYRNNESYLNRPTGVVR